MKSEKTAEEMTVEELQDIIDEKLKENEPKPNKKGILKQPLHVVFLELYPDDYIDSISSDIFYGFKDEADKKRTTLINKMVKRYEKELQRSLVVETAYPAGTVFERWGFEDYSNGKTKFHWLPEDTSLEDEIICYGGFSDHWAKKHLKNIKKV